MSVDLDEVKRRVAAKKGSEPTVKSGRFKWVIIVLLGVLPAVLWWWAMGVDDRAREKRLEVKREMEDHSRKYTEHRDKVLKMYGWEKGYLVLDMEEAKEKLTDAEREGKPTAALKVEYEIALKKVEEYRE